VRGRLVQLNAHYARRSLGTPIADAGAGMGPGMGAGYGMGWRAPWGMMPPCPSMGWGPMAPMMPEEIIEYQLQALTMQRDTLLQQVEYLQQQVEWLNQQIEELQEDM
jgi:hypothetical protein